MNNIALRIAVVLGIVFSINVYSFAQEIKPVEKKEILFKVNSIIDVNDCILWHTDFSKLKSTVLYKDHFISMALYGGFIAFNKELTHVNYEYSEKLNSDLYTNLTVRHDTLFAEKFSKIYFLSDKDTSWLPYKLKEPVVLFNILFEDEKYAFFPIARGEFGSILFIYDKVIRKLRVASYYNEPKCVYFDNDNYYISSSPGHFDGTSKFKSLHKIKVKDLNIIEEKQNLKSPLLSLQSHFLRLPITKYPNVAFNPNVGVGIFKTILSTKYGTKVHNSFKVNNKEYHFTDFDFADPEGLSKGVSRDKTYITEIVDSELRIVDSIESFPVARTRKSDNYTIIECTFVEEGCYISNTDSLYYVRFIHPDKNDYENFKNNATSHICEETFIYEPNFKRKFSCKLDSNLTINSFGSNFYRQLHFQKDNNKVGVLLNSDWNTLNEAFKINNNWHLNFKNLGNVNHKYGQIEIYNLKRFVREYSRK